MRTTDFVMMWIFIHFQMTIIDKLLNLKQIYIIYFSVISVLTHLMNVIFLVFKKNSTKYDMYKTPFDTLINNILCFLKLFVFSTYILCVTFSV